MAAVKGFLIVALLLGAEAAEVSLTTGHCLLSTRALVRRRSEDVLSFERSEAEDVMMETALLAEHSETLVSALKLWRSKHNHVEATMKDSKDAFEKFITANKHSNDRCSARILEAKRTLDELSVRVEEISEQVTGHTEVLSSATENLKIAQDNIAQIRRAHEGQEKECHAKAQEAKEEAEGYEAELEELRQMANPDVKHEFDDAVVEGPVESAPEASDNSGDDDDVGGDPGNDTDAGNDDDDDDEDGDDVNAGNDAGNDAGDNASGDDAGDDSVAEAPGESAPEATGDNAGDDAGNDAGDETPVDDMGDSDGDEVPDDEEDDSTGDEEPGVGDEDGVPGGGDEVPEGMEDALRNEFGIGDDNDDAMPGDDDTVPGDNVGESFVQAKAHSQLMEVKKKNKEEAPLVLSRAKCESFLHFQTKRKTKRHKIDPRECDSKRDALQEEFSEAYRTIMRLKVDAQERVDGLQDCLDSVHASMTAALVPLVQQRDTASQRSEDASSQISLLTPVLESVKDRLEKLKDHIEEMKTECKDCSMVSQHLLRVRELINSLEHCPGRGDYRLRIPEPDNADSGDADANAADGADTNNSVADNDNAANQAGDDADGGDESDGAADNSDNDDAGTDDSEAR